MAPPADPPTTITLRIKVPPGHIEGGIDEFTIGTDVPVSAHIGEIRERIQRAVASNPPPERQRLLYGGRALVDNDQTLADALNIRRDPTQTEYVVHLLVKGDGTATAPVPQRRGLSTPGRASPAAGALPAAIAPPGGNNNAHLPHDMHAHHNHLHQHHVHQHHQQHHAAMLAQQHHLPPQMQHQTPPPPFGGGHLTELFGFGMQPMQFAGGVAMPPGPPHVHPQHIPPPPGPQPHVNIPATTQGPTPTPHTDGSAESHPTPPSDQPEQPDPQQRSASQPPPQPRQPGLIVAGRGPTGQVFHFQQHIQLGPQGILPPGPGLPHMTARSQLERARGNVAEMRRMLAELRALDAATDEQRERIDLIQQRITDVNNYIDPFNIGGLNTTATRAANTAQGVPMPRPSSQPPRAPTDFLRSAFAQQPPSSSSSPSDVRCYLLSSPSGPQALLISPEFGVYRTQNYTLQPMPTSQSTAATTRPDAPPGNQEQAVAAQPAVAQVQVAQAAIAQQDGLGILGAGLINHMWLLMRILIFAYFILGANLGWQRPLALVAIAVGFWLLRQGPLGEGGILRRWWDGVLNQDARAQPVAAAGQQQDREGAGALRPGQMPTPAQVAQRILEEERQQRNNRLAWLREQIRPAERAIALLVASLWPGVGEAYVRALEAEERRRNEEEIATRRREQEERQKREEDEKKDAEEGEGRKASSNVAKHDSAAVSSGIVVLKVMKAYLKAMPYWLHVPP
ncbi:hypothetical protein CERZMDRAFT_109412 [Cercospora zeae-maydis SCOH1-5]|uniref:Ubiquitin-like domain-containing protein n=1 Tax=Cercospora zeae-maydis SCOH1-5 TaxID=717836 RepID=A0A6A6FSX1_9PEZI|nr:hypothetical protein CERZMDRAFT_109412 [Cercospora zeae-maydis SCOH1-5]